MNTIYKIRHKVTGLWSLGGANGDRWNKKGKTWNGLGPLKNHLRLYITGGFYLNRPIPEEWEVLSYTIIVDSNQINLPVSASSLVS